ncbi:hypothetical protein AwWohl_14850 [Gammaproteobacteria bacterium]|nr:hypothetical protein AwWohl_14850 [Gammaproteobacteria bacterium]
MYLMDNLLLMAGAGIIGLLILNVFLNKACKFTPAQSGVATSLISIAVLVPMSIYHWPGGDVFALYLSCNLLTCYAYYLIGKGGIKALKTADGKHLHWAPLTVFFFFLFLIIVEASLITLAERGLFYQKEDGSFVSTRFAGEVPNAYQKKESYYNDYQQRLYSQLDRGWLINYGFADIPKVDVTQTFIVEALSKDGIDLKDAIVVASFVRPADQRENFSIALEHLAGSNLYQTNIDFPVSGVWQLILKVTQGDNVHEIQACTEIATKEGVFPKRNKYRPNENVGCKV